MAVIWRDERWVSRTPFVTSVLLEGGAVGQIVRMVREQTAAGQSLLSWIGVTFALVLWHNFYTVKTPGERPAIWTARLGIVLNAGICCTIVYFRYLK